MATITPNLTLLDDNDNSGDWGGTDGPDDYNTHIQGTNSESWQISKNSTETATWSDGSSHDMSAADTHLYIWLKSDLTNYYTTVKIQIISTNGNYREYEIANQTTKIWNGAWKCFVLNLAGGTETGTFASNNVNDISVIVDNSSSGNIRSVINTWIDVMRYGTGITIDDGTTDWNFADAAAIDEAEANKYGVLENYNGIIFCQGRITVQRHLNSTNEVLVFKDEEVSANLYELSFSNISQTPAYLNSFTVRADGVTDIARFVMSNLNVILNINGISVTRAGLVSFNTSGDNVQTFTFNDCLQISPKAATFQKGTVLNYTGTEGGSVLFPADDTNFSDITFIKCDQDIEYDATSDTSTPSLVNIIHDDNAGDFDINNTSGGAIILALSGTSNGNSYTGSAVTFSSSSTLILTVKDENGDAIGDANAYIDDDNITPFIMNTTTNSTTGIASVSHTDGAISDATWRVRKYGYKPYKAIADVPATGTKNIPVTLIVDPQQT